LPTFAKKIYIQYYKALGTEFILGSYEESLCLLDYRFRKNREGLDRRLQKGLNCSYKEENSPVIKETIKQLEEYFSHKRKAFDIKLLTVGTDFQKSVWSALEKIPYAQTSSYLNLAKKIGNEKAVRAVANANGANAISIIIPCHRIIGTDGKLTGYAGGLDIKEKLLNLEKQ